MNQKQPTGLFPLNSSQFKLIWVTNFWSCFEGERNLGQFSPLNDFYNLYNFRIFCALWSQWYLIRLPTLLGVSQWVHINRSHTCCENLFLRNGSFTQRKSQFFLFEVTETAVYVCNFFKANYGQIHNSYNQFDKGYIRRLPVISLAEPCSARWTCLHDDGFPVFWDGRSFFIHFYKPRALHSLGNQRSAEPQGGYKDESTAFKRYVTVSLPSQNAPTTL